MRSTDCAGPKSVGGLNGLIARSEANLAAIAHWVARTDWVDFLAEDAQTRSCTSICLKLVAPWFATLPADRQTAAAKRIAALLEKEGAAYDIAAYRDAPPGLRIWGGATVETADIRRCSRGWTGRTTSWPRSTRHRRRQNKQRPLPPTPSRKGRGSIYRHRILPLHLREGVAEGATIR